jgi:hypothetical protein
MVEVREVGMRKHLIKIRKAIKQIPDYLVITGSVFVLCFIALGLAHVCYILADADTVNILNAYWILFVSGIIAMSALVVIEWICDKFIG